MVSQGRGNVGGEEVLILNPDTYLLRFLEHLGSRSIENK
jgi:hypothetical protein